MKIGNFRHEALSPWLGCKFITLSATLLVCSTFAVMQCVMRVYQRQLILVTGRLPVLLPNVEDKG